MPHGPYSSPTFSHNARIDLSEPVGSASISPSARDIALASRSGLRILDLDHPQKVARFIPCHVRSSVADVQWSPHAFRDSWICSTAGSQALLWDVSHARDASPLLEQLRGHNRSITDINFSAHHPEILATCSIDTFIHVWDVRVPAQPVLKFADWHESVSQVKFNRQDEHVLASAQGGRLEIWDDRKGAIPVRSIRAHATKIYGIDWHREYKENILTCSLDKSIKLWNWTRAEDEFPEDSPGKAVDRVIRTGYPVWRARFTPFGHGILAMPQRSDTRLHLYDSRTYRLADRDAPMDSVHLFCGHQTPVKEFLWRHRGSVDDDRDMRDFQLVSVSADQSLRLHHLTPTILSKIGYQKGSHFDSPLRFTRKDAEYRSFLLDSTDSPSRRQALWQRSYANLPPAPELARQSVSQRQGAISSLAQDEMMPSSLHNASFESQGSASSTIPSPFKERHFPPPGGSDEKRSSLSQLSSGRAASARSAAEVDGLPDEPDLSSLTAAGSRLESELAHPIEEDDGFEDDLDLLDMFDEDDDDDDDALLGAFIRSSRPSRMTNAEPSKPTSESKIPPPRTCSARWSATGDLVCLFPAKPANADDSGLPKVPNFRGVANLLAPAMGNGLGVNGGSEPSQTSLDASSDNMASSMFRASGLHFDHPPLSWQNHESAADSSIVDEGKDEDDVPQETSKPLAITHAQGTPRFQSRFGESFETAGSEKASSASFALAGGSSQKSITARPRPKRSTRTPLAVSLRNMTHYLPAKLVLAEEYALDGDTADICKHNARVSKRHRLKDHAHAWEEAALLLRSLPKLDALERPSFRSSSGFSQRQWRVGHPIGRHRLQKLLHTFEMQADEQMLAMLAFVFERHQDTGSEEKEPDSPESSSGTSTEADEDDEAMAMVRSRRVRLSARAKSDAISIQWKNEDRFRRSSRASGTNRTIDMALHDKFYCWRKRYADLLYRWGFYEARAQMLKANGRIDSDGYSDLVMTLETSDGICECIVCNAKIHGEAKLCGAGAHCMHEHCYRLFEEQGGLGLDLACPLGCDAP